jgi:hypothetical protein
MAIFVPTLLASCGQPSAEVHAPIGEKRTTVTEVEPIESSRVVSGQTIYVPAYSSIYTADRPQSFSLAITLSVRNTDRNQPIVVTAVTYHDRDGQLVREYLKKPRRLGPLAALEFFVNESDTSNVVSTSFLVDWVAEQIVSPPVVETVMVGTASSQGISFLCTGTVLSDKSGPSPGKVESH